MNIWYFGGALIGAFVITFLLSRLALLILRSWNAGAMKLLVAHAATLATSWTISAFGNANGGPLDWSAGIMYVPPVLVWLAVDILRRKDALATDRP